MQRDKGLGLRFSNTANKKLQQFASTETMAIFFHQTELLQTL